VLGTGKKVLKSRHCQLNIGQKSAKIIEKIIIFF